MHIARKFGLAQTRMYDSVTYNNLKQFSFLEKERKNL